MKVLIQEATHRRGRLLKGFAVGVVTALAGVGLVVSANAQDDRPAITVAIQQLPDSLEPVMSSSTNSFQVVPNIFDFLLRADFNSNFALGPGLITKWRRIDDLTIEADLRTGVIMHDGRTMTAEDVAFSFGPERVGAEDAPAYAPSRAYLQILDHVDVVDADTVRFVTAAPDPVFEKRMAAWMFQVVSKEAFLSASDFASWQVAPVSTGPYKVQDLKPREELNLVSHDEYWGGLPPYKAIKIVEIPEQSARIAGLVAGDYDVISDVNPDQLSLVEQYEDLRVVGGNTIISRSVRFSVNHPVLQDPRIRLALALSIDREALVEGLWGGRVDVMHGFQFPYFDDLYIEQHKGPEFDPERAKKLMSEAGYDGSPIPYLIQENWYPVQLPTAEAVAAMWEAVGFNIDIQVQPGWDTVLVENPGFIHDGATLMNIPDPVGAVWRVYGKGSSIDQRNQWRNEEFFELGAKLEGSMDPSERRAVFQRMLEIVDEEDVPGTELHIRGGFYGKRADIAWEPTPAPYMIFGPSSSSTN